MNLGPGQTRPATRGECQTIFNVRQSMHSLSSHATNSRAATWGDITRILNMNSFLGNYADFTGHNDPDMLEVGNGALTAEETRTHFALWALMKSPLLMGTDITQLSQANIDILQNKHLIAFNQDSVYGKPAVPYKWVSNVVCHNMTLSLMKCCRG